MVCVFGAAVEAAREPLVNYVAIFNEMDYSLRTAGPSVNATNHVIWVNTAIQAKQKLRLSDEINPWLTDLSTACSNDWRVLRAAATGLTDDYRWNRSASTSALVVRLMDQAYQLAEQENAAPEEMSRLIDDYISILFPSDPWSPADPRTLSLKTIDIPDKEQAALLEQTRHRPENGGIQPPDFPQLPSSYESAASDGEMIRWLLANKPVSGYQPLPGSQDWTLTDFAMAFASTHHNLPSLYLDAYDPELAAAWMSAIRAILSGLRDDQTVVWGNQHTFDQNRFNLDHLIVDLPPDYQYMPVYKARAQQGDREAAARLGNIFINRFQPERAAEWYERAGRTNEVRAIRANQGRLSDHPAQCQDTVQSILYSFRNGSAVDCSIHPINLGKDLLPRLIKGSVMESEMRLLEGNSRYFHEFNISEQDDVIGPAVTNWSIALSPAADHLDSVVQFDIPRLNAGFYLLRAAMRDGNTAETVLHIYDTLLLKADWESEMDEYRYPGLTIKNEVFLLCDARTGEPYSNCPLHFVGTMGGISNTPASGAGDIDGPLRLSQYLLKQTDADGRLVIRSDDIRGMMPVAHEDRAHPFISGCTTRLSADDSGWDQSQWTGEPCYFLATDRPVYRPGDTARLKYWIPDPEAETPQALEVIHKNLDRHLGLDPAGNTNQFGNPLLDSFGGCDFLFHIPSNAPLGRYQIGSSYDRYGHTSVDFHVEEYRAPELLLNAELVEDGKLRLTAQYAYGEPLAKGILRRGHARFESSLANCFYPAAPLDPAWDSGYWWHGDQFAVQDESEHEIIYCYTDFDLVLDEQGSAFIDLAEVTNGAAALAAPGWFSVAATVIDSRGKEEYAETMVATPVTVLPRLCCWLDQAFYTADQPITCHFAHGPQLVPGHIEIRRDEEVIRIIQTGPEYSVQIPPLPAGNYAASLVSIDGQKSQSFHFLVGTAPTELTPDHPVRVVVQRGVYTTGETAKILLQTDRPGRWIYFFPDVSSSRGFVPPRIFKMKDSHEEIELELDDRWMDKGILRCAALTVENGNTFLSDQLVHIISPELDAGQMELTPDRKRYAPGEEVNLTIQTRASDGTPRPCSVTVTVYNEALDLWAPWHTPNPVKTLLSGWRNTSGEEITAYISSDHFLNAVAPRWIMRSIIPRGQSPFYSFEELGDWGYGGGVFGCAMNIEDIKAFENPDTPSSLSIREDFRDLAYWNATVLTDCNGYARVTFPMPDGLVKWKVQAWAVHTNYAAAATASVECAKDFVAQLYTPRFMREGDELGLAAGIRNHATNALKQINSAIETKGISLISPPSSKTDNLTQGAEANVYGTVYAEKAGEAEVTFRAWTAEASDGMKKRFPVLPRGLLKRGGRSGVLAGDRASETITIVIPEEIDPSTLECRLNVSPDLLDALADALPFLEEYPHGCAEQTLNRFLPALIIMSVVEELGGTVTNRAEVIERAVTGCRKLTQAARSRDRWSWNLDENSPHDPFITAWIARGLRICKATGELDGLSNLYSAAAEEMLSEMEGSLKSLSISNKPPTLSNVNALQAVVIGEFNREAPKGDTRNRDRDVTEKHRILSDYSKLLLAHADQLSLYGKVLLALAFDLQGDAVNRDCLVVYIEQFLEHDAESGSAWLRNDADAFWLWYNDDIEMQAWYLKLLNRMDPCGERAAGVAQHLMLNRTYGDHWKSTRDTAICVEALAEFARNNHPASDNGLTQISLNEVSMENPLTVRLRPGTNTLTITAPAGAIRFHDITWSYRSRENPITAETCELVTIERRYYHVSKYPEERIEIPAGKTVAIGENIQVELIIRANRHLEYLLAEDFKPAGFETFGHKSGYMHGVYREFHDERVSFYLNSVPKGETRLTYELRPEFSGALSAQPATIELMYEPRMAANSAEQTFCVRQDH